MRYHYDPKLKKMVEGPGPRRVDGPSGDGWRFSDRLYSANPFKAPDGTIINSKKSHVNYMKRAGVTTMDDFKGTWERAAKEREAFYSGQPYDSETRRRDIVQSIEALQRRR